MNSTGAARVRDAGERPHVPRVVLVRVHRALGRQDVERRETQIVHATRRASSSASTRPRSAERSACRSPYRSTSAAVSTPRRDADASAAIVSPNAAAAPPPTAAYCRRMSSCAFADQGMSSQSRHTQSVDSASQNDARSSASRRMPSSASSTRDVVEEATARARVHDARAIARRDAEAPPRDVLVAADDDHRARAHVLLLAHDLGNALRAEVRERLGGMLRADPSRDVVSDGDIVGGR